MPNDVAKLADVSRIAHWHHRKVWAQVRPPCPIDRCIPQDGKDDPAIRSPRE